MNHPEYFYIITTTLASSDGKSINELKFQNGISMTGRNLSKTPTLYYVKKGYLICKQNVYKEGDTFTINPEQEYTLKSMDNSILLEFESSFPEATYKKTEKPKLWVRKPIELQPIKG
jgi:hypothetical protein